jgi:hypothetical protein
MENGPEPKFIRFPVLFAIRRLNWMMMQRREITYNTAEPNSDYPTNGAPLLQKRYRAMKPSQEGIPFNGIPSLVIYIA